MYDTPSGKTNLSFNPEIIGYNDYYPFGMLVPNRHGQADSYRYGFQGQEKDDEVKGEGNSYNYKYRMHDPRVGRFFTVDPLFREYPHYTPYSFAGNKVIRFKELEGLEEKDAMVDWLRTQGMVVLDWQDKRSGFFKATGHLIDGGLLFSSGFALTASTEGVGAALGGGSLMTLGIAEMSLGIANFTKDKRASKANNFMELVGMQMEEKHGLTNAGAYLYYGQEVIEVGTSIRNAYKFIKSGEALRIPTSLRDLVKNSKAYVGTFNVFVSAPSRTITMTVEGLYDVFIANTPSEALRNLDLQSWKSTVEFFDANVNKVESKLGVKLGFEVLDKNGKLFVSDDFIFEVKDEAALRDFFKNLRKEVPQMEKRKKAVERAKRIQEREPRNYCFVSGTKVFTPEGLINIELLRKGDTIYSFNFKNNSFEPDIVENNFERLDDKIFRIVLGNNVIIEVTEEHPFMEYNLGKWIKAKDLNNTNVLRDDKGNMIRIDKIEIINKQVKVFNLTALKNHNYFVSPKRVLVHNKN